MADRITDFMRRFNDDLSDTAFLHMRTMMIFPENFVRDLIDSLAERRIGAIIGFEPYGYSLRAKRLYAFSTAYQPSIEYRGNNLIHNYPAWAERAGLSVRGEWWLRNPDLPKNETATNRL